MQNPIRLSLKTLRAFTLTVDHGSIALAAAELNIAASAVGAALDQVEDELGATLLVRTRSRGISATAEGREMADRFRSLLDQYDSVLDRGRALTQTLSGTLRIGYYAPVAPAFMPAVLTPLMNENPKLIIETQEHDNDSAQDALLAGRLDVILFAGHDLRRGIATRHLLNLPPYVLAPKGHAITRKTKATLGDLAEQPLVLLDRPLARPYVERLFKLAGLNANIIARADSTEMVRSLVGAGAGLSVLAMRPLIGRSYGGDQLICIPLETDQPGLQLLAGHSARHPRRVVSAFLEALDDYMQSGRATRLTVN